MEEKLRYSDAELEEFRKIIQDKLQVARHDYDVLLDQLSNRNNNGIDDTMLTTASGCFVLDSEVGLAPIMRLRTTFGNELTRQLAAKFRQLF